MSSFMVEERSEEVREKNDWTVPSSTEGWRQVFVKWGERSAVVSEVEGDHGGI